LPEGASQLDRRLLALGGVAGPDGVKSTTGICAILGVIT